MWRQGQWTRDAHPLRGEARCLSASNRQARRHQAPAWGGRFAKRPQHHANEGERLLALHTARQPA